VEPRRGAASARPHDTFDALHNDLQATGEIPWPPVRFGQALACQIQIRTASPPAPPPSRRRWPPSWAMTRDLRHRRAIPLCRRHAEHRRCTAATCSELRGATLPTFHRHLIGWLGHREELGNRHRSRHLARLSVGLGAQDGPGSCRPASLDAVGHRDFQLTPTSRSRASRCARPEPRRLAGFWR